MSEEPWQRTVECLDGVRRQRAFVLTITDHERTPVLALQSPPGEAGLLTLSAIAKLKRILDEAEREIAMRGLSKR